MGVHRSEQASWWRDNRGRCRLVVAVAVLVALCTLVPADAAPKKDDPKTQRDEVRKRKVEVAAQLDKLKASSEELQDALDVLDANLRIQEAALENAQAEVDRATKEAEDIQQRQAETQAELDKAEQQMKDVAVAAYAKPPVDENLFTLNSSDLNEAVRKQALLDIVGNQNLDTAERIRGLKAELETLGKDRLDALARAEEAKAQVQAQHDQVEQAQQQQQAAVDALDNRNDPLLGAAQGLAAQDKALSAEIERQAQAAAAAAAKAKRRSGGSSGGSVPNLPSSGDIVSVRGIYVHRSIADNLANLLAAADDAGISLGGGGYRDSSGQIALRRAHCGTSDYDVYQKPAFQCHPPTARPGTSNHERGLAIDFTSGGGVLTRSSAAFRWLQGHAARYGFYNLPSEPWHWSVDGN
jgi:LAS superfamily LD-carboxypeptidase LdcB